MQLRIPLFDRRRASYALSATLPRRMTFYRHSDRERFQNPLPGESRVAVISPHFLEKNGVRCFGPEEVAALVEFAPETMAGTVPALLRLASVSSLSRAVVVFSGARIGVVNQKDRDLLWMAFQVPLFEQSFGPDGAIIARECEAHDGLHVAQSANHLGNLRTAPCPCGRVEPRM